MNLHIFSDYHGLYLTQTVERVKKVSSADTFINIIHGDRPKYNHEDVQYFLPDLKDFFLFVDKVSVKVVYFHYYSFLSSTILTAIREKNSNVRFVWVFWSSDFYNLPPFISKLYLPFSQKYLTDSYSLKYRVKNVLSFIKHKALKHLVINFIHFKRSLKYIDYIACLLDSDFENIVRHFNLKTNRIQFAYVPYSQLLTGSSLSLRAIGNKIMVNHSGDPTLNHYEILDELSRKGVSNTIALMLSYGNKEYIKDIKAAAISMFDGKTCLEINEAFINPEQYPYTLVEIGYSIFNCKIQQGIGNIILLLWLGVKVFMREENPVFIDFKKWGLHVFSVQKDLKNETFEQTLSDAEVMTNRKILDLHLSEEKVNIYYQNLIELKKANSI